MIIKRIYNNNVVESVDDDGKAMIIIGRGIAFGRHPGDWVDPDKVEQTFKLSEEGSSNRFPDMLGHIDDIEIYLPIANDILNMLRTKTDAHISEGLLLTLADHISTSIEREKRGVVLENSLLPDIRHLYKNEFRLAKSAAEIIAKETGVNVSDDEVGFIALHIVNATEEETTSNLSRISKIVKDIQHIVEVDFGKKLNVDSLRYERFIRHLQFFARRVLDSEADQENNLLMFDVGRREFPRAYKTVRHINSYMQSEYSRNVTDAEQGYLIYHVMNVIIATEESQTRKKE